MSGVFVEGVPEALKTFVCAFAFARVELLKPRQRLDQIIPLSLESGDLGFEVPDKLRLHPYSHEPEFFKVRCFDAIASIPRGHKAAGEFFRFARGCAATNGGSAQVFIQDDRGPKR